MEFVSKNKIKLDRKLSKLDEFVLEFVQILDKYVNYVIISGYISILFGRARATEDIDLFIEKISKEKFFELYNALKENGFWCLNAESEEEIFNYLKEGCAVRFSRKGLAIPNFEIKFPKNELEEETFQDYIIIVLAKGEIKISSLERQIAFKRYYLKSDKDIEDALHIEILFKEKIDYSKINKLKEFIEKYERESRKDFS